MSSFPDPIDLDAENLVPRRLPPDAEAKEQAAMRRAERLVSLLALEGSVRRHDISAMSVSDRRIDRLLDAGFLISDGNGAYRLAGAERTGPTAARSALWATSGLSLGLWSAMAREGLNLRWLPHDPRHVHVLIDADTNIASTDWYTVHPTRRLDEATETTYRGALRSTTVARTIRDFTAFLPRNPAAERQLDAWVDEARVQRKLEVWQIEEARERERSRKVRKRLADLHARHVGTDPALFKSIGEEWLRDLVRRLGLPEPLWNVVPPFATKESDAYFPGALIVEFDGYWAHRPRGKHHRDRAGDRRTLVAGGIPTVRVTKWDFDHDLPQLEHDIAYLVTSAPGLGRLAA